jgi:hypothetical protein
LDLPHQPKRWEVKINSIVKIIEQRVGIREQVFRLMSGSADAVLPAGMVNGWRRYLDADIVGNQARDGLLRANEYFETAIRGAMPWAAVAERLSAWTLLRAGAFETFLDRCRSFRSLAECSEIDSQVECVTALLRLERTPTKCSKAGGLLWSGLEIDRIIASALAGNTSDWMAAAQMFWLGAWLGWRSAVIMGDSMANRERLRQLALGHAASVPRRAEAVVQELKAGTPLRV